jgi:WD40 repeat protein
MHSLLSTSRGDGRFVRPGWGAALVLAIGVLPLAGLFSIGNGAPVAAVKPAAKRTLPVVSPNIGSGEPTDFETTPTPLQFQPLENRYLAVSPDGHWLASAHGNWLTKGRLRVWDLKSQKEVALLKEPKGIASVVFSPDGKLLATAGWDQVLRIREMPSLKQLHAIPLDNVARLAFSPDGKTLASAAESQKLQFWDPRTGEEKPGLKGTFFRMQHVAYSPNGRYLAVGGGKFENPQNGRVALWDLKSGKQLKVMDTVRQPIVGVAFSPDSGTLVAGGLDQVVRAWSVPDLSLRYTASGHTGWVERLAFSPDGKTLATASHDHSVRLWDAGNGESLAMMSQADLALSVVFARDGKTLYSGGADSVIFRWDPSTYRSKGTLQPGGDSLETPEAVLAVACSPDGKYIATAHDDKTVRLRDAERGNVLKTLRGHDDVVAHLAFSPDGKLLATGSFDKTIKLWNIPDGSERRTLKGHTNWVFAIAFSPDGKTLASGGYDKTIRLWNVADGKLLGEPITGHAATVRCVAWSPDGKRLVSGSGDRTLKVWDVKSRKAVLTLNGHKGTVRAVEFSPDGTLIASAAEDRTVKLWHAATGIEKQTLTGHGGMVWCLAFSPQGKSLASGGFDNAIFVWDPANGGRRTVLRGHTDVVTSLAFAPDMRGLISGSYDKSLRLWKTKQPPIPPLLTITVSPEPVRAVGFSPDGRYLAAAGHDMLTRVWDLRTGKLVHVLRKHTRIIRTLAFSPDSRQLATAGVDRTILVWDVRSGKPVTRLNDKADRQGISTLAFTPNGRRIVSGGMDQTVRAWDLDSRKLLWKSDRQGMEIVSVDVSPDGKTAVSATGYYKRKNDAGRITFWNVETGKVLFQLAGPKDAKTVEFSPDGRQILVGSGNSQTPLLIWDVNTRQRTTGPAGFRGRFLPDGRTVALARGPNRKIFLYDLAAKRELAAYTGHQESFAFISAIAVSPDGSLIVSASHDGTVKLWPTRRTPPWKSRLVLQAHAGGARVARETPDGKRLVTAGQDKTIKIWDLKTGNLLHQASFPNGLTCGDLSPDGNIVAVGGFEHKVRFWDMRTQRPTGAVIAAGAEVRAIRFLSDSRRVMIGDHSGVLQLCDSQTGKVLQSFPKQDEPITEIALRADDKLAVTSQGDWKNWKKAGHVKLWDVASGSELAQLPGHTSEVTAVQLSADGKRLVTHWGYGQIAVWDVATRRRIRVMKDPKRVHDAALLNHGRMLASANMQGQLTLWNVATGSQIASAAEHVNFIYRVQHSNDGKSLYTCGGDGTIRVWPLPTEDGTLAGRVRGWDNLQTIPRVVNRGTFRTIPQAGGPQERVFDGIASPDFRTLAVVGRDGLVRILNANTFATVKELKGHTGSVRSAAYSPDGRLLATAGDDKTVRLWDVNTGNDTVLRGHEGRVVDVVFTPDGNRVISGDSLGHIDIWDVKAGKVVATFRNQQVELSKLAISPDGSLLAVGAFSNEIDLWRLRDRKLLTTLTGHKERILALTFSPDGNTLISGDAGVDKADVIKLWDVPTRSLRASLKVKVSYAAGLAFSPDGRTFVTSGSDTQLRFWDAAAGRLLATVPSGHRVTVRSIQWSPDATQMITTSLDGTAKKWTVTGGGGLWMPGFTVVDVGLRTPAAKRAKRGDGR